MTEKCMEKGLIENCAPTLAGMKSASLFNYFHNGEQIVREELVEINHLLNDKGVYVDVLIWREKSALIYVYRMKMLEKELKQPGVLFGTAGIKILSSKDAKKVYTQRCFPYRVILGKVVEQ